ncbi:MAG: four helix bundle protein [Pirellulaceae bacterium]
MGEPITDGSEGKPERKFDLEERTAKFGDNIIRFCKTVPFNAVTRPLISQLVRSATSIGANYCEGDDAQTKKEFRYKMGLCRKESRETKYWLRMIAAASDKNVEQSRIHWQEAKELHLIFVAIIRNSKDDK